MNILELDSFDLADAVKFNDQLNPRIWQGKKMRPEVREKLLEIAADFKEFLGLSDLDVKDITVSGSNAAYTYTPQSDIDLHLVVDIPKADQDEVYRELFDAKKYQYNDLHNIKIGGYDVELYVENANKPPVSKGVFSVLNNDWISIPRQRKATVDDDSVRSKYEDIKHRIEDAVKSNDTDRIDTLAKKIKAYRQAGLDRHGELGSENLAYKMLRNQGYIKKLYDARAAARDAELSLAEQNKVKKPFVYGFRSVAEDATLTPDGVNPTTCMFLNEKETPSHTEIIFDFMKFAVGELGLENVPSLKIKKDPQWSVVNKSFGRYRNDLEQIELAVGNRHIMDVLRTLAHELQHRKQDEREKMPPDAGKTGSPYENEAHVVAGILMRKYADQHPEYFEDVPVAESASGYIPKNKKEAAMPQYAMALSVDIKPGETGRQANKMALKTDAQGKPALLMKTANMIGESRVSLFNWLKQQFPSWPDYVLKDFLYQQAKGIRDQAELEDFLKRNKQDYGQVKWRLEKLPITLDIFTPKTQRMIKSREGGTSNPFDVPRDAERHAQQSKMIQQQGVRTEPIIVAKLDNGYDLIEGWHRTIQHLKAYPQGYVGPAWVGYGATYQSIAEGKSHGYNATPLSQVPGEQEDDLGNQEATGPEFEPQMPAGTTKIDVADLTDWYRLGQDISDLDDADPADYGKGPPQTVIVFPSDEAEQGYLKQFKRLGLKTHDMDPDVKGGEDVRGKHLKEANRRDVLKTMGAGAAAAAVPGMAKAGEFVDVKGMAQSQDQDKRTQVEKIWIPRYQELTQRCQDMLKKLIAAAGPQWAPQLKGTTIRVVTNQNYAQASALSRQIMLDLSVFWDAPDAALAFAIGHELGHIALDHAGLDDDNADYATKLRLSQQSRQQELDADQFAVGVCRALGYNKAEILKFITQNEQEYRQLEMMLQSPTSTHPTHRARIERAKQNGFQLSRGGIEQMNALKTHLAEDADVQSLQEELTAFKEQDLFEVKMTSKNLAKLAKDIKGVKVGLEFEMIVPDARVDDDGDMEPDYEQDERVRDIDDAVNFFDDGDYNSRNELRRLREAMESDFFDWQHEKIDELWNSNDGWEFFTDYLDREDPFDEDEAREEATNELQAQYGDDITPEEFETMLNDLVEEKSKEYYQEQWDEQGRNYDYAREEFEEEQRDNLTEEDWLDSQGIRYASDVESSYGYVSWPYYTSGSDGEETDIERIALDFMNGIGADTVAYSSSYHGSYKKWTGNGWVLVGSEKPDDCFSIEPDGSLDGNSSDDVGLEFVSPPTPLEQVPDLMKRVQSWAADNGVYTGKANKTSIHTNISVPGYDLDKLDYLKAALLLGDEYVLREFDRIGNTYAAPAIEKVKQLVQQKPEKAQELLDKMKSQLNAEASKLIHSGQTNKFTSINTKNNRVEFRSPGGDYLSIIADNPQKMIDTINRMVVTLDAAMDPNKYKEEYQKKLYKVLTGQGGGREAKSGLKKEMKASDKDLINIFSRYAAGELPRAALKSFVRQAQLERRGKKAEADLAKHNWAIRRRDSGDIVRTFQADDYTQAFDVLQQYKQKHNITDNSLTYGPYNPAEEKPAQQGPFGIWDTATSQFATGANGQRIERDSREDAVVARAAYAERQGRMPELERGVFEIRPIPQQPQSSTQFGAARGAPNYAVVRDSDGTVVYRFYADDRSEALGLKHDFVQMQGWGQRDYSLRDESESTPQSSSGPTLNGRPSNPDGNYVIANRDSMTVPVYRFMAAGMSDATEVLNQWRAEHPGEQWVINPDANQRFGQPGESQPIPGSTLDLQRQRAAAAQQNQGNWGIWIDGASRFANQPGEYPRGAEVPLYRFPSREAAEQWIEQQRAERPRMRTDIEVREIEPREPLPDLFPELPGTPAAQQDTRMNYELYDRNTGQAIETFPARNDSEAQVRLSDFRDFSALARQNPQWDVGVRRGPGVDNTAQPSSERSSYELYRISDGRTVTAPAGNPIVFRATDPADAESKIARYAADFNLGAPELFAVRSVLNVPSADAAQGGLIDLAGDNWSADFERRMQGGGNNPEWENPQPAPTFGGSFTGEWKIVDPNGNEIYRFSGVGNAQSDANRVAMQWLQRNPRQMQAGVEVLPVMG